MRPWPTQLWSSSPTNKLNCLQLSCYRDCSHINIRNSPWWTFNYGVHRSFSVSTVWLGRGTVCTNFFSSCKKGKLLHESTSYCRGLWNPSTSIQTLTLVCVFWGCLPPHSFCFACSVGKLICIWHSWGQGGCGRGCALCAWSTQEKGQGYTNLLMHSSAVL